MDMLADIANNPQSDLDIAIAEGDIDNLCMEVNRLAAGLNSARKDAQSGVHASMWLTAWQLLTPVIIGMIKHGISRV